MNTSEQTLSSRVIQRVSVIAVYTTLIVPLVACTDFGKGISDTSATPDATKPASVETTNNDEESINLYSDVSSSTAVRTDGFVGEVLDDSVRVSWKEDPDATGYNIYRQGKYHTTVFETEFYDTGLLAQDYSYEIIAFEKNGTDTRFYSIAIGLTVSVPVEPVNERVFRSPATDGFIGEVLDGAIRISWNRDPDATGYNVYRQGKYYTTVFKPEFYDADTHDQDYSYEIKAFEKNGTDTHFYSIATGLTVSSSPEPVIETVSRTPATNGFVGEVLDEGIRLRWIKDSDATGYNVYRQGKYYSTVFKTEFLDADIQAQDYAYEIKAFQKSGAATRFYSIANGLTVSVPAKPVNERVFRSPATDGFIGEVLDGAIRVSWNRDPDATGYNVYRQGKYYTTVFNTEFQDADIQVQDYSYEIKAFQKIGTDTRYYTIATGLTVSFRTLGKSAAPASSDTDPTNLESGLATKRSTESITVNSSGTNIPGSHTTLVKPTGTPVQGPGNAKRFESVTTEGFVGEVLDDSIRISWTSDPKASGYNVYRQAKYYKTVFATEFYDTDVYDQNYYYEIQAFDNNEKGSDTRYYYIATGLTVSARTLGKTDFNRPKPNDNLLQDYELVFSDEFNDNSLDASKWNTSLLWGTDLIINNEEQYYVDILKDPEFGFNPFTFDGNNLTINSIKTPAELAKKSLYQPYLSGIITSYDAFKFTYGYAEVRARMTHGRGYWPAFWLLNAYYGGDDPEIDIMEFVGDDQDVVYHTFHYHDANGKLRSTQSEPTPGIDYTSDFHTFSVEWKPGSITYFVDGIETHRINDPEVPQEQMYLIANTAVGGWWAGSPDESTPFPGKYVIDYIRVYQKATLYNDMLYNDDMTSVPYADDIPKQALPNHRPTREQWPEGYPYR